MADDRDPRPSAEDSSPDATHLAPALTGAGRELLDSLTDADVADPLASTTRLRAAGHAPELVAAVLTQAALRRAARTKLGDLADRMLFTRDGLEQATRRVVAERRAERFTAAGLRSVADLGCGIGADALGLARAGLSVVAVERDPVVAAVAAANMAALAPGARVEEGDALAWAGAHADDVDALWFDPARRRISSSGSARVFDPEAFSPPLSFVLGLAAEGRAVGAKLGPGLPHEHVPAEAEAEWVSVDGDVVEVVLWFNALTTAPGVRAAAVIDTRRPRPSVAVLRDRPGGSPALESVGEAGLDALPGCVLHEPDGAVIRAGLVTDLGAVWEEGGAVARLLDPHLAYLVTEAPVPSPLARGYRVEAVHPLDVKALRRWVRERGITRLDVKKRGVDVRPEELRARLLAGAGKGAGKKGRRAGGVAAAGAHGTLVLARVGGRRVALEVTPLDGVG
ncbi:class I SAM-dependent methyltransferase [Micrococcus sp. EYE_162]|uniref:class I SAM-dependent methyltransferase n=1 Tax=unclassified Micrococcus TaxID=2620948 RepID=UPI0020062671|nr:MULTISPECIES: class I SAM-dependent methyltransferase [unclassified Micrococcus]MCK6095130.1 class I SAM-dependent methyltransferase [Micrococcus sp. EYE_212]MCK6171077.1 class I SAM-dependent methyltransferase [Micrococcus sp. EYE_162]